MSKKLTDYKLLGKCKESVLDFFEGQKKFKQAQTEYEQLKAKFYSDMEEYFEAENVDKTCSFMFANFVDSELEVNRIQKSSVIFDAEKLEKKLGKEISKNVIVKKYEITDMKGLTSYLRECDIDPRTFKSFLSIAKTVDVKELERLEELGKISAEQIKGCYSIKKQKPYFTVGLKKWHGEND